MYTHADKTFIQQNNANIFPSPLSSFWQDLAIQSGCPQTYDPPASDLQWLDYKCDYPYQTFNFPFKNQSCFHISRRQSLSGCSMTLSEHWACSEGTGCFRAAVWAWAPSNRRQETLLQVGNIALWSAYYIYFLHQEHDLKVLFPLK